MRAALCLFLLAMGVLPARAQGFPSFDAVAERVVAGRLPTPGARRVGELDAQSHGAFAVDEQGIRLTTPASAGESSWVARGVSLASGVVRARFAVGSRLDASVLLRAAVADDAELLQGLAVSIERNKLLKLYRYQERVPRPLGSEARIEPALIPGTEVELVIVLSGPFIMADLYDGTSFKLLAHVAAHDAALRDGAVGVRMHAKQDARSRVLLLCTSVQPGPTGMRADDGAGDARVAQFDAGQRNALPGALRERLVPGRHGEWLLLSDPRGVEWLRRLGLEPLVRARVPFFLVDASLQRPRRPPTATASGFLVDDGYKDPNDVEALLRAYADRFPQLASLHSLGTTTQGRPLWALKISDNVARDEDEPSVLLDGAHHGGELLSTEAVLDAVQQLLERYASDVSTRRLVDGVEIWCVPLMNPDGLARFVHDDKDDDRKNGAGVDLYRNYPVRWGALGEVGSRSFARSPKYRGPSPASEAETRALMALAQREHFVASIDFHTAATLLLAPYTDPGLLSPTPNEAWSVAEEISAALPLQSNGRRFSVVQNLYPVDGTAQDWLRFTFGTVALLLEMPTHNPLPYARGRALAIAGVRPAWRKLLQRVLDGARVSGRVVDEGGAPLEAAVWMEGVTLRSGERWTARARDGRFDRLLTTRQPVRLRFEMPGFASQTRELQPDGAKVQQVVLVRSP